MRLVELTFFNARFDHPARIFVNPDFVVFLVEAQGGSQGAQCWMRLDKGDDDQNLMLQDLLVQGSIEEVAAKLSFSDDPALKQGDDNVAAASIPAW